MTAIIFDVLLLLSCSYAVIMGGGAEKAGSIMLVTAALLSWFATLASAAPYVRMELTIALIDIGLFAGLCFLALIADRYWPLWLTSMQLVTISSHPAFGIADQKIPIAYAVASTIWAYPMLFLLAIGTYRYRVRTRTNAQ